MKRKPNDDSKNVMVGSSEKEVFEPVTADAEGTTVNKLSEPVTMVDDEITINKSSETKPVAQPEDKTEPQMVPLKVFVAVSGQKPDQMAGFSYFANREKLTPRSIKDWREAYAKFMATPIN